MVYYGNSTYYNSDFSHYGVKGMKWGVRKSSNQSSTKAERKAARAVDRAERKSRKKDYKKRRSMSDVDLKKKVERLKLEKEYRNLTNEDVRPGLKYMQDIGSSVGKKVLPAVAAGTIMYGIKAVMDKKWDWKEAAKYIAANPNAKKK